MRIFFNQLLLLVFFVSSSATASYADADADKNKAPQTAEKTTESLDREIDFNLRISNWLFAKRHSVIVYNNTTRKILFKRYPDHYRYPASLTKLMTLYLVFEALEKKEITLDQELKVSKNASRRPPSKLGLKEGETITVKDAINALIVRSANDVATTVAENLAGSEDDFARLMTLKTRDLRMRYSQFYNASGLPHRENRVTAREMVILTKRLRGDFPQYMPLFEQKYFRWKGRTFRNSNRLLFAHKSVNGMKTGFISDSGFNIVVTAEVYGQELIFVVIGGESGYRRNELVSILMNFSKYAIDPDRMNIEMPPPPLPVQNPQRLLAEKKDRAEARAAAEAAIAHMPLPVRNPLRD